MDEIIRNLEKLGYRISSRVLGVGETRDQLYALAVLVGRVAFKVKELEDKK